MSLGKKHSLIILLLLLMLLNLPAVALAQQPAIRFEQISLEEGLSDGTVYSIVQDQTGFMWFGTQTGLNKYNGYDITVFRHTPSDENSVANDNAGNLFRDSQGIIWIGTWGSGMDRLDPRTEQFTHYPGQPDNPAGLSDDRVQTIYEDSAGRLWIGTAGGGLNLLDRQTQTFTRYQPDPTDPHSISHERIWRIVEDPSGLLWVATSEGLNLFDPQQERFTVYKHDPDDPDSLIHSLVRTLYVDKAGVLWVGTEEGLDRFNRETETFTHFTHDPNDPTSLPDNTINALLEDQHGNFWVGTSRGGLNRMDRQTGTFDRYLNDPDNPYSLSYNDVRWVFEDRSGVMWVATRGGGVNKFNWTAGQFTYLTYDPDDPDSLSSNDVRAIYRDQEGLLWIGTKGGGLNKFDGSSFTHYQEETDGLTSDDVYAIHEARNDGALWLGMSGGGLIRFEPETEAITAYLPDPNDPYSLSHEDVNSIYEDQAGFLWIGTKGGGLNRFDPRSETFTRYQHDPDDPTSLGNNDVYGIYQDRSGTLWVCTYGGGLNRLDPDSQSFTRYQYDPDDPTSLSSNDIYTVHQDQFGVLWVGTANGGLNKMGEDGGFTRYTQQDGLYSDVVYGILEDQLGNLWLSTSRGLSRFEPSSTNFINYDISEGLEYMGYNIGAYYQSRDGEIFFGGINGLVQFIPAQVRNNPHPPPVVITGFNHPHGPSNFDRPIWQLEEIELSYEDEVEDETFSFEFAALDYTDPTKNQYAYQMEGFNKNWIEAGNIRFASYTNLSPGSYTFRVRGANNAGVWNEEGASIRVVVTPPFWRTWWFQITAVLLGVGVVYSGYKFRIRQMERQRERLQALVQERTVELSEANRHLQSLTARLQSELSLAREIQQSLLPPPRPDWPELDIYCYSIPAQEVGGDFYAYHSFAESDHFGVAVGDATGKGMPAALVMAVSLASFQSTVEQRLPPSRLVAALDRAIVPYIRKEYQNCAFCYIELQGATLKVANAGGIQPAIRRRDRTVEWIDEGGPPLGIGLGAEEGYSETTVSLQPGDMLILLSDGVVEAMTTGREMFGFERLTETIAAGPTDGAETMVTHLRTTVSDFLAGAEPHDDLTIVVLRM